MAVAEAVVKRQDERSLARTNPLLHPEQGVSAIVDADGVVLKATQPNSLADLSVDCAFSNLPLVPFLETTSPPVVRLQILQREACHLTLIDPPHS